MTHNDPLLAIGELSRASGLTVSALRFYDREGLLTPADVDPTTGYRRYSPGQVHRARLLAGMRRVGMPLAEMAAVVDSLPDTAAAQDLLDAHLRRLEDGLADARREVSRLGGLLPGPRREPLEIMVDVGALTRAIDGVSYAASTDPDFPMLCGVLCEPHADGLRLVATDRYRLAVAEVQGAPVGHPDGTMALLPTGLVHRLRRALWEVPGNEVRQLVRLRISPSRIVATLPGALEVSGDCLDLDFPDYRRLLHADPATEVTSTRVPATDILASLAALGADEPSTVGEPRRVHLSSDGVRLPADDAHPGAGLLLDRAFLWEAARSAGEGYAVLPAAGEIAPLALRGADGALVSLVMPVRPEPAP